MVAITAVVSPSALSSLVQLDRINTVPSLKRAAILCENVFFHTIGLGEPGSSWSKLFINAAFGGDKEDHDLTSDPEFLKMLLRPEDYGPSTEEEMYTLPQGPLGDVAWEYIKTTAEAQAGFRTGLEPGGRATSPKDWMKLAVEISTDLQMPNTLGKWLERPVGLIGPFYQEILRRAELSNGSPFGPTETVASLGMIDFGSFTWSDIFELRRNNDIADFRVYMDRLETEPSLRTQEHLFDEVAAFIISKREKPMRTLFSGIIGGLPGAALTAFGVASTITQYFRQDEENRQSRWLHFLAQARVLESYSRQRQL